MKMLKLMRFCCKKKNPSKLRLKITYNVELSGQGNYLLCPSRHITLKQRRINVFFFDVMCLLVQVADRKVPLFSSRNGAVFVIVVPHSLSNNDRAIRPCPLKLRSTYEYMYNERCLSMGVARTLKHHRETTVVSNASHQLSPFAKRRPSLKGKNLLLEAANSSL